MKVYGLMGLCLLLLALLAAACGSRQQGGSPEITLIPAEGRRPSTFTDPVLIEGEYNYNLYCAHCHGYDLRGQLGSTIEATERIGMHIVPPQDSTGHSWQHPDQLLIQVIKEGIPNPLFQYPMPPFGDVMTDAQIESVLAYIRLFWTEAQRQHQAQLTRNWAEMETRLSATPTAAP